MGLFSTREPRRFNLPPIYWDERKERLRKIKERALNNEDKDPHRMQDITERLISQKRKRTENLVCIPSLFPSQHGYVY